jgi:hypothetical protein
LSAGTLKLERTHDWVAVNSYRVRVAAFALVGIPIALHVLPRSPGALFWTLFLLQFAIYPHLMQWRTRRCEQPEKAELDNLIVDAVLSGAWAAGLAFPLWISVALFLATLLNHAIMRGMPGVLICPVALLSGALASTTVIAFRVSTDTVGLVTLSSVIGLAIYLSLMGVEFYTYIRRLHEVQEALAAHVDRRIRITTSIGISATSTHSETAESLIRCADEALYLAKQNGRNRVVAFGDVIN